MRTSDVCAVLTGDIVASQRLNTTQLDDARVVIAEACERVALWSDGLLPRRVEISRGDAWQLLLRDPALALRVSLWIRSALLYRCGVDTRVAVGIGTISSLAATLAQSGGLAFVYSGQTLDEMTQARLAVVLPRSLVIAPWVGLVSRLCDTLVGSWTQRQAELIHVALSPQSPTQSAIAANLSPPVSKQAVGKGLRAANWDALSHALDIFEGTNWSLMIGDAIDSQ